LNRELKNIFLFLLFFSSFTIQATSIDFVCSVKNFVNMDEDRDDEFINSNLKKRFIISVGEQEVIVTSISDNFNSGITKFKIFDKRDPFGAVKARSLEVLGQTIVIHPENGNATISLQSYFFLNAWLLDCNRQ
jgi:hypothetical protein